MVWGWLPRSQHRVAMSQRERLHLLGEVRQAKVGLHEFLSGRRVGRRERALLQCIGEVLIQPSVERSSAASPRTHRIPLRWPVPERLHHRPLAYRLLAIQVGDRARHAQYPVVRARRER